MKSKIYFLFFIYLTVSINGFSQSSGDRFPFGKYVLVLSFGGMAKGEIKMNDHLTDSLRYTLTGDSLDNLKSINSSLHIASFHLTLKCKGQILGYLENKSGNTLTDEMKDAILKLHSGCSIIFDGMTNDKSGKQGLSLAGLRLELVLK